ncbi:MAG: hypothetical protein R3B70_33665 [Polyangiaceae bacterium]
MGKWTPEEVESGREADAAHASYGGSAAPPAGAGAEARQNSPLGQLALGLVGTGGPFEGGGFGSHHATELVVVLAVPVSLPVSVALAVSLAVPVSLPVSVALAVSVVVSLAVTTTVGTGGVSGGGLAGPSHADSPIVIGSAGSPIAARYRRRVLESNMPPSIAENAPP